jgi:hypothetical protein
MGVILRGDMRRTVANGPIKPVRRQAVTNQTSPTMIACLAIGQSFQATFSSQPLYANNLPTDPHDSRTVLLRLTER